MQAKVSVWVRCQVGRRAIRVGVGVGSAPAGVVVVVWPAAEAGKLSGLRGLSPSAG